MTIPPPAPIWKREFASPISLASGATLRTLEEARVYLVEMPWRDAQRPEWRTAMQAVLTAATNGSVTEAEQAILMALRDTREKE
jgi:hypothetical protein